MKRIFIALLLAATAAVAQEKKAAAEPEYNSVREFKNKVFEIKNRDPRDVAQSVKLLGSGFKGADLNVSTELKTITVRDFPENIAAIEEAIKRLDHAAPATPDIEFKISVLIGSKSALNAASIPDDLESVVRSSVSRRAGVDRSVSGADDHRVAGSLDRRAQRARGGLHRGGRRGERDGGAKSKSRRRNLCRRHQGEDHG